MTIRWTEADASKMITLLRGSASLADAVRKARQEFGDRVTYDAIAGLLKRHGHGTPATLVGKGNPKPYRVHAVDGTRVPSREPSEEGPPRGAEPIAGLTDAGSCEDDAPDGEAKADDPEIARLIEAVRRKPLGLRDLCDKVFDASPRKVEAIVERAAQRGFRIAIAPGGEVVFSRSTADAAPPMVVPTAKVEGEWHSVGLISDIHFGSLYHRADCFAEWTEKAIRKRIDAVWCSGDSCEGKYKHAQFELAEVRLEDQLRVKAEAYSKLLEEGIPIYEIDGNHDFTFTESVGMDCGQIFANLLRDRTPHLAERYHFLGARGRTLVYGDTKVRLWHPKGGAAYALTYKLQRYLEAQGEAYDFVQQGHFHQNAFARVGSTIVMSAGTFQSGQSAFGRSIGGKVALMGHFLKWHKVNGKVAGDLLYEPMYFEDAEESYVAPG